MLFAQTPELKHRAGAGADGLLLWLLLLPLLLLAVACGQQRGYVEYGAPTIGGTEYAPSHYYPPPGPPGDPWGPYIREAAGRYGVPEQWVRAVMKQESGGQEQAISPVGAMGLMQVMPATYDGLRARYGLGADPYDPHNNILAGTAYIREMYDRFGAPAFLAAYNAGPDRVEAYLAGAGSLPDETQNYLASVTPNLGSAVPMSGPLAVYASAGAGRHRGGYGSPDVQSLAAGCDLSAAYNPSHPCSSLMRASTTPAPVQQAYLPQTLYRMPCRKPGRADATLMPLTTQAVPAHRSERRSAGGRRGGRTGDRGGGAGHGLAPIRSACPPGLDSTRRRLRSECRLRPEPSVHECGASRCCGGGDAAAISDAGPFCGAWRMRPGCGL